MFLNDITNLEKHQRSSAEINLLHYPPNIFHHMFYDMEGTQWGANTVIPSVNMTIGPLQAYSWFLCFPCIPIFGCSIMMHVTALALCYVYPYSAFQAQNNQNSQEREIGF